MTATTEGVSQVASALTSIVGDDTGVLSEESTTEATGDPNPKLTLTLT